ncbi:MAG TPA: two-component regulator propeller domain-containing protein [Verrucomicrobiae bacterium]|nr:two-component regulator propeller domain-containing protein [Verrucomicrobiae bacterium]
MRKTARALFTVWLWLCGLEIASSADTPAYIVDSAPAGLPQSSVISIAQTRDGYLWLGTRDGLARFDGNRFEVFTEWNTPGLKSSTIVRLFADSRGGLWVGTPAGANYIKDGHITDVDLGSGAMQLASECEDITGAVWLYTVDNRLARCRDGKVENVWPVGARFSNCRVVITETNGQMWMGTDTELISVASDLAASPFELLVRTNARPVRLDYLVPSRSGGFWQLADRRVSKVHTNQVAKDFGPYPWGTARIMAAIEARDGHLIVGTQDKGVFRFTAEGISHRVPGLTRDTALSLCEDREGNLWVGTDGGGLNRVKRNPFNLVEAGRDWVVQSVSADTNGGIWLGFFGSGASYWKDGKVRDFGPSEGLTAVDLRSKPNFSSVLVDKQQRVWVGTRDAGLFEFINGRFQFVSLLFGHNISALYEDRSGKVWAGTGFGLAQWDGSTWQGFTNGLVGKQITAIVDDANGNVWIGTAREGLYRWANGELAAVHQTNGLPCENITSLCADADGVLWVGTGNGLGRLQGGRWTRFGAANGLATDNINYLIDDELGNLWVGSNVGLMRVAKKSLADFDSKKSSIISCRVYGFGDGLPTSECSRGSQPAACRTRDGRLWFPTIRGLVTINPSELTPNTNPPPVAVESILLDDVKLNTNTLATSGISELTLPAGAGRLEIIYTSLNLAAPEGARYRYWMEGLDKSWSSPTSVRQVTYRLPPGDYQFHVTACNEDGIWNEQGVSFGVTVLPPFWQKWWFITAVAAGILATVASVVYFVSTQRLQRQLALMRQQEALEKERARIARDLHDQLGANLTQVALLGEMAEEDKNQPAEIESHAKQISQTARDTSRALDEIVWAANPQNDTLEGLVNYACKYAQDYLALAGLRYRLEVPPQLPATVIPPDLRHNIFLAFKESVNNVVKHARANEVKIRLRLNGDKFTMEVEDDGRGPGEAATKKGRNGLRNMRKRMEDVGGEFILEPGEPRGTRVRLTAPLKR